MEPPEKFLKHREFERFLHAFEEVFSFRIEDLRKQVEQAMKEGKQPFAVMVPEITMFGLKLQFGKVEKPTVLVQKFK